MVTFCSGTDVVIFFTPFTNLMFCFIFVSHPEQCITGFVVTTRVSLVCLLFPPAKALFPLAKALFPPAQTLADIAAIKAIKSCFFILSDN